MKNIQVIRFAQSIDMMNGTHYTVSLDGLEIMSQVHLESAIKWLIFKTTTLKECRVNTYQNCVNVTFPNDDQIEISCPNNKKPMSQDALSQLVNETIVKTRTAIKDAEYFASVNVLVEILTNN